MPKAVDSVEQQLRVAIDSSPSGILMCDAEGRIVLVNREIERLFGHRREEILGQFVEALLPERIRDAHGDWRADFVSAPIERRMGEGRDLFARRKDGIEVPVEVGLTPIVTPDGVFVSCSVVDISARKRAEQRFRVAVESAPCGMLMVDLRGHILLANREVARMFGYGPGELLGQSIEILVPPSHRARHPGARAAFFARPSARAMGAGRELRGIHKDGHEVPVEIGLNPIETEEGLFVLGSVVDVTERHRAEIERAVLEEDLRQSQKLEALGRLAGGIAHDFNNILSAVVGYAEVIRVELEAGRDPSDDIDGLLSAAERGREVTSRVLKFSRRQALEVGTIDLVRTVEDAAGLLRAALPSAVRIELDLDHPDHVVADPGAVHTILMNLGTNAAHAMPEGGTLGLSLTSFYARDSFIRANPGLREGAYVKLSVRDTGGGMDKEIRTRAFEPFFTTKAAGVGTGLGLATVHGLMRDQGGTVWLESAPGTGTTVHCLFPAVAERAAFVAPDKAATAIGRGERVLFVDDEPTLTTLGARRLSQLGYEVIPAVGPRAALERLREERFQIMITDFTMPEMDGLRLASAARRIQNDLRVVLLSGRANELGDSVLAAAGVERMLEKPVTIGRLAETIRAILDADRTA